MKIVLIAVIYVIQIAFAVDKPFQWEYKELNVPVVINNREYRFLEIGKVIGDVITFPSYEDVQDKCGACNLKFAAFETEAETEAVYGYMMQNDDLKELPVYTSGYRDRTSSTWTWGKLDGTPLNYTNWSTQHNDQLSVGQCLKFEPQEGWYSDECEYDFVLCESL